MFESVDRKSGQKQESLDIVTGLTNFSFIITTPAIGPITESATPGDTASTPITATQSQRKTESYGGTSTETSTGSANTSASNSVNGGLTTESKIGLGVGLGVGIPAVILAFLQWAFPGKAKAAINYVKGRRESFR
jgi:hypothetical protein